MSSYKRRRKDQLTTEQRALAASVERFNASIAEEGERIVREVLPRKILQLDLMAKDTEKFDMEGLDEVLQSAKVDLIPPRLQEDKANGMNSNKGSGELQNGDIVVPCNKRLMELMNILKDEILSTVQVIGTIKTWIQLMIPRIEAGNNFGVSVQEECVSEVGRAEDLSFGILEGMAKYYQARAKLVAKFMKHRNVMDYRRSILECDEMQFINVCLGAIDLRNNYVIMYDLLIKNIDRIKQPKGNVDHSSIML